MIDRRHIIWVVLYFSAWFSQSSHISSPESWYWGYLSNLIEI